MSLDLSSIIKEQRGYTASDGHHFLVQLPSKIDIEELEGLVARQARRTWPFKPLLFVRVRVGLYTSQSPVDHVHRRFDMNDILHSAINGLYTGGMFSDDTYIWQTWSSHDKYPNIPNPILSVFVGWGV